VVFIGMLLIYLNIDERMPINVDTEFLGRVKKTTNPKQPIYEGHLGERKQSLHAADS